MPRPQCDGLPTNGSWPATRGISTICLSCTFPIALVLRSNYPPIRGAAAVREFFFGALDAGLGEVEIEPLRVDIVGDLAYEAGRCKALIPSSDRETP